MQEPDQPGHFLWAWTTCPGSSEKKRRCYPSPWPTSRSLASPVKLFSYSAYASSNLCSLG